MKRTFLIFFALLVATFGYGQKTEINLSLNSGLFSFTGKSAEPVSGMNYLGGNTGYTNNPFGSKNGLCIGLSGNIKHVSKGGFVIGAELGYEVLRNKMSIGFIYDATRGSKSYKAKGRSFLNYHFISLRPFLGYRIRINKVHLDITGGFELGYNPYTKEKARATSVEGVKYKTKRKRSMIGFDVRPGFLIHGGYKKFGVYAGYAYGLANYKAGYVGTLYNDCYSRVFRFGLTYRLN